MINSRAYPGLDCRSDHNAVAATVRLRIKRNLPKFRRLRLNLADLETPSVREKYNIEVNNRFESLHLLEEERTPDVLCKELKDTLKTAAEKVLGKAAKKTNKPWISEKNINVNG